MQAMQVIQKLPLFIRQPLMRVAMVAMQNPQEAIKRAALIALPVNILLLYLPHFMKVFLLIKSGAGIDNTNPRGKKQSERQSESPWAGMIHRCQSAHRNSLETLPMFAFALLACIGRQNNPKTNYGKQPIQMLTFAAKYTFGRALYILLYVFGVNQLIGGLRTASYFHNIWVIFGLLKLSIAAPMR
jgi:uncharacterized MAPEG superfamily protein